MLDTDLTLLPMLIDVRQDAIPIGTKAHFDIWNEEEVGFSGTMRCIGCWDQTLLGNYELPNQFMIGTIHTDKGKARIDGQASYLCPESVDAPLLGVAAKILAFSGTQATIATSGTTLVGQGKEVGMIYVEIVEMPGTLLDPEPDASVTPTRGLRDVEPRKRPSR